MLLHDGMGWYIYVIIKKIAFFMACHHLVIKSTGFKLQCPDQQGVGSKLMTLASLSKIVNHDASSFGWDVKPLVLCVAFKQIVILK